MDTNYTRIEYKDITAILANFVCNLKLRDLDESTINYAKMLTLDGFGNEIGAYNEPGPRLLYEVLQVDQLAGPCTVVGYGAKTSPMYAACMNGMLAHARDVDAAHRDALTKTGAVATPAVFAAAEAVNASGEAVLLATVAGYELMIRMGLALNPSHRKRGFHSTSTTGVFGAAAAAGKLFGFNAQRMSSAFGIAGTQAAGLTAFIGTTSMIKPFNVAKSAFNGVLSACLARRDFGGPANILESPEGFMRGYADELKPELLFDKLGKYFHLTETGFKPHAACRYVHTLIDGALLLRSENTFNLDQIEHIEARVSELAYRQCDIAEPRTLASAQGSAQFSIAAALVAGGETVSVEDFKEAYENVISHALNKKITLKVLPDIDYMSRRSELEIVLKDGRKLQTRVDLPKGEPENPMSKDQIIEKYMKQAEPVVGAERAASICDRLLKLEELKEVRALMDLTVANNALSS